MNQTPEQFAHDATVMLAAAVVERSAELLEDGWVQGKWYTVVEKDVPVAFCILGAFDQAIEELMPKAAKFNDSARHEVKEICTAFVLDEIDEQHQTKTRSIPGWNDDGKRSQEEVVKVMRQAAARLWDIALDSEDSLGDLAKHVSAAAQRGAGIRTDVETEYQN